MPSYTVNKKQQLFVMNHGTGYTCLGFDNLHRKGQAMAGEMGMEWQERKGTKKAYKRYTFLIKLARQQYQKSGKRLNSELHPQLTGMENRRVEVVDMDGEKYRFQVGKSTGWIPCHLQIHNSRSTGGPCVDSRPFKSVSIIR